MILLENSLFKLHYNPVTDILEATYPDFYDFLFTEIKDHMDKMVEIIHNYDIKRVLLNLTSSILSVNHEQNLALSSQLLLGIEKTRVEKLARLEAENDAGETSMYYSIEHLLRTENPPFQVKVFSTRDEALNWLKD
ncbi:hypothetical protein [Pontibacter burrus]|uniref:STAS/SEC14 domain-containing protein n=1 Tax=Pontibacter burrus TaxID=2704466 RepID=A0A6B3LLN1_9BACT|nr:hypothetical protein [Pontibacter burrus]NEM97699.1 hypothetical protein [Pontibacter burrus]